MQPKTSGSEIGSLRVIVIDDDDFTRSVVVRQLNALGLENVLSAHDWPAARGLLLGGAACDVVVTDLDMPGSKGNEFLQELSDTSPGIGVILMSALNPAVLRSAEKQAHKLPLRVLGSSVKPTSLDTLRALLAKLR